MFRCYVSSLIISLLAAGLFFLIKGFTLLGYSFPGSEHPTISTLALIVTLIPTTIYAMDESYDEDNMSFIMVLVFVLVEFCVLGAINFVWIRWLVGGTIIGFVLVDIADEIEYHLDANYPSTRRDTKKELIAFSVLMLLCLISFITTRSYLFSGPFLAFILYKYSPYFGGWISTGAGFLTKPLKPLRDTYLKWRGAAR